MSSRSVHNAFQDGAFQFSAFQIVRVPAITDRGYEETLAAFVQQRRRDLEEKQIREILGLRADLIAKAIKPFTDT